jgi:pilus biogenesis lipoprotein CpaD
MRSAIHPLLTTFLLGALAACNNDPASADLSLNAVATDNQNYTVEAQRAHRYVYVARGSGNLSDPDRASLGNFIAEQAAGRKAAVHVALTGPVGPAELAQLTRALVGDGIDPDKIEYRANRPAEGQLPPGRAGMAVVDIETERWKSVLPVCPDHSRLSLLDTSNPDDSNFGCTSLYNLSAMVSDPRDLVVGETGGHTDAELTTGAIERLLTNKVKPLTAESSKGN